MDEQTIVINDLLSFAWCKLKLCSVSKEELRQCLQSFYSPPCATEALETLLLVLPSDFHDTLLAKQGPVRAILDLLSRLDASAFGLPVFVCKNLNNVPNFEAFCKDLDAGDESPLPQQEVGLYREHETIKSELSELCGSLHELKKQLQVMTSQEGNSTKAKGGARRTPASFHSKGLAKKIKEEPMAVSETKIVPSITGSNVSSLEDDEYDGEQRTLLIANRYQRALARRVEKGGKANKKLNLAVEKFEDSHEMDHITFSDMKFRRQNMKPPPEESRAPATSPQEKTDAGGPRRHYCLSCPFSSEDGALTRSHTCLEEPCEDSGLMSDSEALDSDSKSYSCSDCDVTFKTVDALNIHKMSHFETDFRCPLCAQRFSEEDWPVHVRGCPGNGETRREDLYCADCDVFFGEKKLLGYHVAFHDESRPFQCLQCKYRFYTQKAVDDHFKMHSRKDHRYKCPFCSLRTPRLNRIREHIRCHTGDKPFTCHLCSYATTTYDTLKGHQRSHSQNRSFKCGQCDKTYKSKNKLRFHERVHAKEKQHKCPVCGRGFNYGMCMTLHYRRHLEEKTHDCPECQFKGFNGNALRKHVADAHPLKSPYQCDKCDFGAKFKSYLITHRKEKHPKTSNVIL